MPNLPPIKPTEAWFVVGPDGRPNVYAASSQFDFEAINAFLMTRTRSREPWSYYENAGYTVRKLLIAERGGER